MADIEKIVSRVKESQLVYCKFLSANDTSKTHSHQCGIYVAKNSWKILFPRAGVRDENMEFFANITWMDDPNLVTGSRFVYYGRGTRNEYRITRFGRDFPYIKTAYTGSLFILCKAMNGSFYGYVLDDEDDIDDFLASVAISSIETGGLLFTGDENNVDGVYDQINAVIAQFDDFPETTIMSERAREIYNRCVHRVATIDKKLIEWTDIEYRLYRALEDRIYMPIIAEGFENVEEFKDLAAKLMNRRKSRAGRSLENHLAQIFRDNGLQFEAQVNTENNKTCDFVFPSADAYHNPEFPNDRIITLGAKTTCKDRWRQVLNEANRRRNEQKFLCTLQHGISSAQFQEMVDERLTLVVPECLKFYYPADCRDQIWSIERFVSYIQGLERE